MLRKLLLPAILLILAYGFWISPEFKQISAGVAIFLFGMTSLEEGFRAFTGGLLESLLRRMTDRLWKSLSLGIITTTVMQSSSLVSVITISFLSAGLIGLTAGIGIIFGANLGTTTGAWLIAGLGMKVDISAYAMPLLVFGVILLLQKSRSLKGVGYVLAGLGFVFLGIHYTKEGFASLENGLDLGVYAVPGFAGLLLFTGIGVAATVVIQSSHAMLVLIITALAAQQITYENALALAIGANIGTTITAIIGAMGANIDGKRLAAAHLLFNVVTGLVAIVAIRQLTVAVDLVSAAVHVAADDYTLKLAVFHTLFNLLGVLLMLPFTGRIVRLLNRLLETPVPAAVQPRYLNDSVMELPQATLEAVRQEILRLYDHAFEVMARGVNISPEALRSEIDIDVLVQRPLRQENFDIDEEYDQRVKGLYGVIVAFISRASQALPPASAEQLFALRESARHIVEAVKDTKHLRKNLTRHVLSPNSDIRRQYNGIRVHLGSVLRQLDELRHEGGGPATALSLDAIRVEIERFGESINSAIDQLIRDNRIAADVATSLMNDSGYAYHIGRNLVSAGETALLAHDQRLGHAVRSVALDEAEIDEIAKAHRS